MTGPRDNGGLDVGSQGIGCDNEDVAIGDASTYCQCVLFLLIDERL